MSSTPVSDGNGTDSPEESVRPKNGNASSSSHISVQMEEQPVEQGPPQAGSDIQQESDGTNGPATEDNGNDDAVGTEPGGETPKDKKTYRCTWPVLKTVLSVCLGLLVFGGLAAVLYRFMPDNTFLRTELQQKMEEASTAWYNMKCLKEENRHLKLMLNTNLDLHTTNSAVNRRLRRRLQENKQELTRFQEADQFIGSVRILDQLDFLWGYCDETTLQCSHCPRGWKEHASRCFHLFEQENRWWAARLVCGPFGGNLAVVHDETDQTFLTNMVEGYVQQHPNSTFQSAWIGLTDFTREGKYEWIDGRPMKESVNYLMQPHKMTEEEKIKDCVAIIPLNGSGQDPLKNWSNQDCLQQLHSICETDTFYLPSIV